MAGTGAYQSTWEAYQQAVNDLYAAPIEATEAVERGAEGISTDRLLEERSDTALARSEELRSVLVTGMETEDLSQRELAALKLMAAAAYDLSVAHDLLELQGNADTSEVERSARGMILASDELRNILDAPLEAGILGLLEVERAVLPRDPLAARMQLQTTVTSFLKDVPEDAAALSQRAFTGLVTLGVGPAHSAASVIAQEILAKVPEGVSIIVRRAACMITEAISKLWTAIGKEQEQQAREQVSSWLDDIQKDRDTVTGLLDKLYETKRIGEEINELIEVTPQSTEAARYNQATQTLEELLARYEKTKGTLTWVMRIVAVVQTPLLGALPWGPLAVSATYLGILGYAIYSGGDYLDWYRMENCAWLHRVQGLRTAVRSALKP